MVASQARPYRTVAGLRHAALALCAAVALMLSVIGPAVDHHFAERQPGHRHIFLDGTVGHTHQGNGVHDHDEHGVPVIGSDAAVNLADSDLSAPAKPVAPNASMVGGLRPDLPEARLIATLGDDARPPDRQVSPLLQPPRA